MASYDGMRWEEPQVPSAKGQENGIYFGMEAEKVKV